MSKEKKKEELDVPQMVVDALEAVAKTMGVAVVELWSIFVRQYLVRGITEAFTAIVLCVASYFLAPSIHMWVLAPLTVALGFFYGAILLVGNPKYYALGDISKRVEEFRKGKKERTYYGGY